MPRYPSRQISSFTFGPGPISTALKALIGTNVAIFFAQGIARRYQPFGLDPITSALGLQPAAVVGGLRIWQLGTYMFLHAGILHILFNMLALWMFGSELERMWGTRFFLKFYFVTGIGAALLTILVSWLPFGFAEELRGSVIVGASGAIYGLLLAYAFYFPDRPIYMLMLFAIPAKYFVIIMGALAFYSSLDSGGGVANVTHLGGLLVGYLYLKNGNLRLHPFAEVKYRYLKWRINRARKKFDVYSGGRADDWDRRVH